MNPPRNMLARGLGQPQMQDAPPMNMLARGGAQAQPFPLNAPGQPPRQQLPPQAYIDALAERGGDDAMEEIEHSAIMSTDYCSKTPI